MAVEEPVTIDQRAVDELMSDIDGPVGILMRKIADQIADVARSKAPTLNPRNIWSYKSSAWRGESAIKIPGYTKRHITTTVGHSKLHGGYVFGGANAPGDPGLFLEIPAEQLKGNARPFLTTGLWAVNVEDL